nr:HNH endonuclease [Brevibacterium sp. 50QC2O2]
MCAVCSLAHPQLLDAAHIIDDSDEHGIASVVNGLALCKIHHAAYDKFFMGIRPDYVIELTSIFHGVGSVRGRGFGAAFGS